MTNIPCGRPAKGLCKGGPECWCAAAPVEPVVAATDLHQHVEGFLCKAWGETDLPAAALCRDMAGVRQFLIDEWLGNEDSPDWEGNPILPGVMDELATYNWADEGNEWNTEFEIGGLSIERVTFPAAAELVAAIPANTSEPKPEVLPPQTPYPAPCSEPVLPPTTPYPGAPDYRAWAEKWHETAMALATIAGGNCSLDPAGMIRSVQDALAAPPALPLQGQPSDAELFEIALSALPESGRYSRQEDYLLGNGASLMSEDSHEIIHVDTLRAIVNAAQRLAGQAQAAPAIEREFTNELGNRIRITIEGPTSTSENILTPREVQELTAALNGQAAPAADRRQFGTIGHVAPPGFGPMTDMLRAPSTVATGQAPAVPSDELLCVCGAKWEKYEGSWNLEEAPLSARAATPPASELSDEELIQIAQNIREPGNEVAESWGVCYGYTQDAAGQYTVPRVPAIAIKFARSLLAGGMASRGGEGWQPIETAPTDGTAVLVAESGYVDVGFWNDGKECYGHRGGAGWFSDTDRHNLLIASNIHPTHWRPFPPPPPVEEA